MSVYYVVSNHLSQLKNKEVTRKEKNITAEFPNEHLVEVREKNWFADMANYKAIKNVPEDYTWKQKKQFYKQANHYLRDRPYLFKISFDGLIHMCIICEEARNIMWNYHNSSYGGHHNGEITVAKLLRSGFLWPTLFKDCKLYI